MHFKLTYQIYRIKQQIMILVFLGIALSAFQILGQTKNFYFDHLDTKDGLSMANVNAVIRDSHGFMWIGTEDGLNRYDGYWFTVYTHKSDDAYSLSNSYIEVLLFDSKQRLWVATRDGLNRYIPEKDYFIRYPAGVNEPNGTINRDIKDLFEDSKGNLWIAGENGVDCMDMGNGSFRHFEPDSTDPFSLSINTVYHIVENNQGQLWIATENGLNLLDPATGKCQCFFADPNNPNSLSSSYIRTLLLDDKDNLWIGTYEKGLDYYNTQKKRFTHFPYVPGGKNSLSHYQVNGLATHWDGNLWVCTTGGLNFIQLNPKRLQDSKIFQFLEDANNPRSLSASHVQNIWIDSSRIWLATRFGGVNIYDKYSSKFQKYSTVSTDGNGLSHLNVTSFTEDDNGRIYIGTDGGGVNFFNSKTGKFSYLQHDLNNRNSLSSDKVLAVLYEAPKTVWIGMWSGGINRYDLYTGRVRHYRHDPSNSSTLSSDNIFYFYLDKSRQLWVGTWSGGLNRYDRSNDQFIRYPFNATDGIGTSGETVMSIFEDNKERLWLATEGQGLNYFNRQANRFIYYQNDKTDSTTISGDYVIGMLQDKKNRFWVTTTNGLNLFNPETGKFQSFHKNHGLPAETLYGIREDDDGNLWISSIRGLSKIAVYKAEGKTCIRCTNYTLEDGLQGEQYGQWSYFKSRDGFIYFGGLNGFNLFHPNDIRKNPIAPEVLINDFQLSLKSVSFLDPKSPLKKPVYLTDTITLSYKESMLSFGFVGIGYTRPEDNQYAYKLENFDKEWHYVGTDRRATYTNLNPGEYIFQVKASNNDGVWNESGASLKLVIPPPFWRRGWFICLMVILIISLAYYLYKNRIRAMEAHRQKLEQQIAERTAELKAKTEEIEVSYQKLSETGRTLASNSQLVNQATTKINEVMKEVQDGTISQNEFVNHTRQLIDSLLSTIGMVSSQTKTSTNAAAKTVQAVESGTSSMQNTLDTMQSIEKTVTETWEIMKNLMDHSAHIDEIVQFIDDIASRVNVLALNALIEAVKAGEYGQGFMVVAKEIRDLAKRATDSTIEITESITKIQADVEQIEKVNKKGLESVKATTRLTDEGRAILTKICRSVEKEKERLASIADKVNEMQSFSQEVQTAIDSVASVSEKNRKNVEKVNTSTHEVGIRIQELSKLAQTLNA